MGENSVESGSNEVEITFSEDSTKAYLCLTPSAPDKDFDVAQLKQNLLDAGVTVGIDEKALESMVKEKRYHVKETVAVAQEVQNGKNGWYEFFFNTQVNTRPKILEDGSVDYTPCGEIPSAEEGQKIAQYHPATEPSDGLTVFGETIVAKKGKDLARLKGKGFSTSEDNMEYFARHAGKLTYRDNWLNVEKELTVEGDVSYTTTGNIRFASDIHVRGNVLSGMTVTSERGGIIVDGYVEAACLEAKKDIVLKNGMQGNGKGRIQCSGSVSGKFFEQSEIQCDEDVEANAILNCDINCGQDVKVSGKFGIIIGGNVTALREIKAMIIGNVAEKRTRICAGMAGNLFEMLSQCEKNQNQLQREIEQILPRLKKLEVMLQQNNRPDWREAKLKLTRAKVARDSQINELIRQKQDLVEKMSKSNQAKVRIDKVVYPGVMIMINGMRVEITEQINHVEYARRGSGIISYNLED